VPHPTATPARYEHDNTYAPHPSARERGQVSGASIVPLLATALRPSIAPPALNIPCDTAATYVVVTSLARTLSLVPDYRLLLWGASDQPAATWLLPLLVALAVWDGRGSGPVISGAALRLIGFDLAGVAGTCQVGGRCWRGATTGLSLGGWWPIKTEPV